MGKNNRSRRLAKQKDRARDRARHRQRSEPDVVIAELIDLASAHLLLGDQRFVDDAIAALAELSRSSIRDAIAAELRRTIPALWSGGWQPVEVVRQARRTSVGVASLAVAAIAADHAASRHATLDERWLDQLTELELPVITDPTAGTWIGSWADSARLGRADELRIVFAFLVVARSLPRMEQLIPPPGAGPRQPSRARDVSGVERSMLDKVRSLLVKAEATNFEAEAEAFTAKAHELMTRHAIDAALLDEGACDPADSPITVRIAIDDPYVDAKSMLLQKVAEASRCRTLFHDGLALSSVVGYEADVAATEMLYTSLLVQAQSALMAEARSEAAGSRKRSRSYRSAFLLSYAIRIGQRLAEINDTLISEATATTGRSVLPALRSRQTAVDDAIADRFGAIRSQSVRGGTDAAGWVNGRLAADQAELNVGAIEGVGG